MDTNELIKALAADARPLAAPLSIVWQGGMLLAVAVAAAAFLATIGPRPDIVAAVGTPRFLFKVVVMIALAAGAFAAAQVLSRPDDGWRRAGRYLMVAPALLGIAVVLELFIVPADTWSAAMIGTNSLVCLTYIPLLGIGPLAIFLLILRHGAPTRPALAGAVAGVLAGGIAATFYAAGCTDDSALFVATWYSIAIAALALVGAAAGRFARW